MNLNFLLDTRQSKETKLYITMKAKNELIKHENLICQSAITIRKRKKERKLKLSIFAWGSWEVSFLLGLLIGWSIGIASSRRSWSRVMELVLWLLVLGFLKNFFPIVSWGEASFITWNIWHWERRVWEVNRRFCVSSLMFVFSGIGDGAH